MARRKRYPGYIRRRGDSHEVTLTVGGKRHRFTVPTTDKRVAEQIARVRHEELERQLDRVQIGLPGAVLMSSLLEKFDAERLPLLALNTQRTYRLSLATFRTFFVDGQGNPTVDKVRSGHVKAYLNWRRTRGPKIVGNRTLEKERATLHAVFAFAEELEFRESNPVTRVSRPKTDPRDPVILTDDQFEKLLDACGDRPMLHLYVLLLGETGARCESEALWLRWEDVDFEQGFIWIDSGRDGHRTKSGKGRWVPMTKRLRAALRDHAAAFRMAWYTGARSPWVFHHPFARRRAQAGDRIGCLRRAFTSVVERAELPAELHQHDLRHRRITKWLAEGKSVTLVREAVGHADLRTTMGYTHLAKEHLSALVDADNPSQAAAAQ